MCGIAAFSIPMDAKINARELAHALLTEIENRGTHASGFAYVGKNGEVGVYKQPKPGSQLSLGELPRDAKTVVLHTRFATQGAVEDNRNNHPVLSTDNKIALVHNGVISNDSSLRGQLGIEARHGEVDSLVIPSLIAQQGPESMSKLAGYAAVAWINTEENGELHIARLKSSPVAYTHTIDGAFIMASTKSLLGSALDSIDMFYGGMFEMPETTMMSVHRGFIYANGASPRMSYNHSTYNRYSGATAGGHKAPNATTASNVTQIRGSEDTRAVVFEDAADDDASTCETDIAGYYADLEQWRETQAKNDLAIAAKALNARTDTFGEDEDDEYAEFNPDNWTEEEWNAYLERHSESRDAEDEAYGEGFYILDDSGDISHHATMEGLEQRLHWLSQMTPGEWDIYQDLDANMRWVNQISDIGLVKEDGTLESWVRDDETTIDNFESPAVRNLQYIREGVGMLTRLVGA